MTGFLKPDDAKKLPCPAARTFATKQGPNCEAEKCICWRWLPLTAEDPRFLGAIKREEILLAKEAADQDGKAKPSPAHLFHKKAVKNVMANPEAYGVPIDAERGWCGLAGRPEQ